MTQRHLRAAIYARYSDKKKQNERSIEDQVALCRRVAERAGYVVVSVYEDRGISGASTVNRRGFQALMRDAPRGLFDVVLTEDVDRLIRDQADFHAARKRLRFLGIEIYSQNGLVGDIEGSVRAMMSEHYLSNLAQKTRRGLAGVVRDHRHAGGRSFGYRLVDGAPGQLAIDEREAETVRRIFGHEHEIAGVSLESSARSFENIVSLQDVEPLIFPMMHMQRCSCSRRCDIFDDRISPTRVLDSKLHVNRIAEDLQPFSVPCMCPQNDARSWCC